MIVVTGDEIKRKRDETGCSIFDADIAIFRGKLTIELAEIQANAWSDPADKIRRLVDVIESMAERLAFHTKCRG